MFVYELSGCGFEFSCSHMVFLFFDDWNTAQKNKIERLKKIRAGYKSKFYKTLGDLFDKSFDAAFQREVIKDVRDEDVKNYLLATIDFGKGMQDDINMYVTRNRLNNASFRQKLNPIAKNISRRQNPLELIFKDISTFDAQNPIISSLIKELDLGKKISPVL